MRCGSFRHWKHQARLRVRERERLFVEMSLMARLPPQRRSLFGMSTRNVATLLQISTQSPHRLRKPTIFRPASSQTKTSSTSALNASIALRCSSSQVSLLKKANGFHDTSFQSKMKCDMCIRKESHANAVLSSGTNMFQEIVERTTKQPTVLAPFMISWRLLHQSESTQYGFIKAFSERQPLFFASRGVVPFGSGLEGEGEGEKGTKVKP